MITSTLFITGYFLISIYIVLFSFLIRCWMRLKQNRQANEQPKKISILIPFRNEEDNLKLLLQCLSDQQYSVADYEIIAIDDHSNDDSNAVVRKSQSRNERLRLISLPKDKTGKKQAIDRAVYEARFEHVVTLDADVIIGKNWLQSLQQSPEADMLILPVVIHEGKSIIEKLQAAEFLSLMATTASTAACGNPVLCNGANLMFKKEKYLEASNSRNDFHISSGDDVFLLHAIKKNGNILWLHEQESIAFVKPVGTIASLFSQRIRWAAKSKAFTDKSTLLIGAIVFLTNLFVLTGGIHSLVSETNCIWFLLFFFAKSIVDFIFTSLAATWIGKRHLLWYLLLLVPIYPVYSIVVPIAGIFVKPTWKNRKVN